MWGAVFRQVFAYVLTRRGKRALAFVGMLSLFFVAALLLDMQLYISATFVGCLAVVLTVMWIVQYWRVKRHDRAREMQRLEAAALRLAAAQEREQRYGRAKAKVADAVRSAGTAVSENTIGVARSGFDVARSGVTSTVSTVTSGVAAAASGVKSGVASGVRSGVDATKSGVAAATSGAARAADGLRFWKRKRAVDGEMI